MSTTNRDETSTRGGPGTEDAFGTGDRTESSGLFERTSLIEHRLKARLDNIRRAHDLDWRTLLDSHREIAALHRMGVAPSPSEFWTSSASPATSELVDKACAAVDDEIVAFRRLVHQFSRAADAASRMAGYDPTPFDRAFTTSVELLAGCALDRGPLDRLGARWQARLHRSAHLASLPQTLLIPVKRADQVVARIEMGLLDQAPWAQDDRLLTAFELAHADIRSHLRDRLRRTSVVVPRRSSSKLIAAN